MQNIQVVKVELCTHHLYSTIYDLSYKLQQSCIPIFFFQSYRVKSKSINWIGLISKQVGPTGIKQKRKRKRKRSGCCIYSTGESGNLRFPHPCSASSIAIPFLRETQKKEGKKEKEREQLCFSFTVPKFSKLFSSTDPFPLGTGFCFEILNLKEEPNQNQIKNLLICSEFSCTESQSLKMGIVFTKMFSTLFGNREARILVLGLDNAGKTTILCEFLSFHAYPFLVFQFWVMGLCPISIIRWFLHLYFVQIGFRWERLCPLSQVGVLSRFLNFEFTHYWYCF